jgi:hypothetical protein
LSRLDIQNEIWLQPREMTLLFLNLPCLDMQNSLGNRPCLGKE